MSPTTEEDPIPEHSPLYERFATTTKRSVGATDRIPLRVLILFSVTIICTTMAPIPFNVVGVTALVLLALDTSLHRR